jgi:hypothetical protein
LYVVLPLRRSTSIWLIFCPSCSLFHIVTDATSDTLGYTTKVNPAGKVPVLQVGSDEEGTKIPESHVILELVSDLFPGKLLPEDPLKRAEARYFIER